MIMLGDWTDQLCLKSICFMYTKYPDYSVLPYILLQQKHPKPTNKTQNGFCIKTKWNAKQMYDNKTK